VACGGLARQSPTSTSMAAVVPGERGRFELGRAAAASAAVRGPTFFSPHFRGVLISDHVEISFQRRVNLSPPLEISFFATDGRRSVWGIRFHDFGYST
jgi:hypothetical protein